MAPAAALMPLLLRLPGPQSRSGSAYRLETPWLLSTADNVRSNKVRHSLCQSAAQDLDAEQWWNDAQEPPPQVQVQGLEKLQDTLESPVPLPVADSDAESREFALAMLRVALDTKAMDPTVLHVAPLVSWTSYLVIVTVQSRPQLNAILAKAEQAAKEAFDRRPSGPAPSRSPWEVLDFGDVVLHLFNAEERDYYSLESFYQGASQVDISHLLAAPPPQQWATKPL